MLGLFFSGLELIVVTGTRPTGSGLVKTGLEKVDLVGLGLSLGFEMTLPFGPGLNGFLGGPAILGLNLDPGMGVLWLWLGELSLGSVWVSRIDVVVVIFPGLEVVAARPDVLEVVQ